MPEIRVAVVAGHVACCGVRPRQVRSNGPKFWRTNCTARPP
jgi:hypothetical protein